MKFIIAYKVNPHIWGNHVFLFALLIATFGVVTVIQNTLFMMEMT